MEGGKNAAICEAGDLLFESGAGSVIKLTRRSYLNFGNFQTTIHLMTKFFDNLIEEMHAVVANEDGDEVAHFAAHLKPDVQLVEDRHLLLDGE